MMQKTLLFALLACPLLAPAQQATITFRAPGAGGGEIALVRPLNGEYFIGNLKGHGLDSTGTLVLPNDEKVPGVYYLMYKGLCKLYVKPGASYTITAGGSGPVPFSFSGPDAEAQQAFNETTGQFYQEVGLAWYKEDSVFTHNKAKALARRDSVLQIFRGLHAGGKMDEGFFETAQKVNNAYHAAVLGATLITPVFNTERDKTKPGYNAAAVRQLEAQWEELKAISDVNDRRQAVSMEFSDYVNNLYGNMYLKGIVARRNGTFKQTAGREEQELYEQSLKNSYFSEPMREYLRAGWLGELITGAKFYSFIPAEYAAFRKQYPESPFNAALQQGAQGVEDYNRKVAAGFSKEQRFVENAGKLSSFGELAAAFKGKTMYVDVWATWCSPCKDAFAHNKALKELLKKNGAEALYVSIDGARDSTRWKDMIKYYDLAGYHVRATPAMGEDIRRLFGIRGALYIPRYMILKNGEVAVSAAAGPGDLKKLEQQLTGVL
jgi:thiol-disulfide isomerase/thioredoxin